MVSYNKASFILFVALSIGANVASAHKLPKGFEIEKFPAKLKKLRLGSSATARQGKAMKAPAPENPAGRATGPEAAAAFLDGNEFIAPGENDSRGPCPFINVMANHGYINRSGLRVPVFNIPALAPVLFDFPEEMFTRPANQAIFDGQVDVQENGEALLDLVRLWDRPGEERDISQVFPNPGIIIIEKFEVKDLDDPNLEFPNDNTEMFVDFRYNVDEKLLQQLLTLSEDGVTMTQEQHTQHLHHRLQESLAHDEFFRLSEDDIMISATQYVLPCIILGEDVEDFSFCPKASIEALWREFRFVDGFAPRSVRFGDAFDPVHYQHLFSEFMATNLHAIEEVLEEEGQDNKKASGLRAAMAKISAV